jgi:hypothetical protein
LKRVMFESSESLRSMLADGSLNPNNSCELIPGRGEAKILFPDYPSVVIPGRPNFMCLVFNSAVADRC